MLPSLKELGLIFRENKFLLMSDESNKQYLKEFASGARFSYEASEARDFMSLNKKISWISLKEDVEIAITHSIRTFSEKAICSDFEKSLSTDGLACH